MAKIVQKWKKVVSGCVHKNSKESLIENDFLQTTEIQNELEALNNTSLNAFLFNRDSTQTKKNFKTANSNENFPIYNEYDNLQHQNIGKPIIKKRLKDRTNQNSDSTISKSFKKVFSARNENFQHDENKHQANYSGLYDKERLSLHLKTTHAIKSSQDIFGENEMLIQSEEMAYCEIPEHVGSIEPVKNEKLKSSGLNQANTCIVETNHRNKMTDSKINLFENEDFDQLTRNINELRDLSCFANEEEAFHWFLNTLHDTMMSRVQDEKTLNECDKLKRLNICKAHVSYARSFYEMRMSNSADRKSVV